MSAETPLPSGFSDSGTGGDSLTTNLNDAYALVNLVWVMISACMVWLMVPGIGLLYSGLSRKKHALSLLWASLMTIAVVSFQWFFWGFSLTFAHNASKFLGTLEYFCFINVLAAPSDTSNDIPDLVFAFYQGMFACVTGMLMLGGACERVRLGPMMVYLFIWMTVVYCPIASWTWNAHGWLYELGALDFAGGGPVHMTSGAGALAYALVTGKRHDPTTDTGMPKYRPHSVTSVVFGTVFLWFGWFGFNGGSAGNASLRGFYAVQNTNLSASCAALSWMLVDYIRSGRKWTTVGLCSGAVSGLVAITPAAGFVPVYFSVPIGVISGIVCNLAVDLKVLLGIDDGMDVFAIHGVGGFVGSVLTALFAADYVAALDGHTIIDGGWLNHHYVQLGYQLAASVSALAWSFCVSCIILFVIDRIPGFHLRLDSENEALGTDLTEIGEFTYQTEDGLIDFGPSIRDIVDARFNIAHEAAMAYAQSQSSLHEKQVYGPESAEAGYSGETSVPER